MKIKIILLAAAAIVSSLSTPAQAKEGHLLVRVRGIFVAPNEKSGSILPAFSGEKVKVNNSVMPEVDVTYMVTNHVGFELIAATTRHSASGRVGATGSLGKLASTWVLPPTLTAQYHITPDGVIRPYIGVGVNYTIFYNERASDALQGAVGPTKAHMSDSLGWAGQIGADIDLTEKIFLNLDVKYVDIHTTARLMTNAVGVQKVKVNLDPFIFGVGLGMRF